MFVSSGSLNCASFMAGVIEAVLEGANFPAKVSAHWHKVKGWCIFRPTQIRYTPLLTYAKFAILHIRPTSTWFLQLLYGLLSVRPPRLS